MRYTVTFHFAGDRKKVFDIEDRTKKQLINIMQQHAGGFLEVPGELPNDTHLINLALVEDIKIRDWEA